jgi:hypothetical protein
MSDGVSVKKISLEYESDLFKLQGEIMGASFVMLDLLRHACPNALRVLVSGVSMA